MDFLIVDGKIYSKDEIDLTQTFREETFRLSQYIWFGFGGIPLFSENIELLQEQIKILKRPAPKELNNTRELFRITKRMLNKNKFYRSGLIHLIIVWRNAEPHLIISSEAFQHSGILFNKAGLLLNQSENKKHSQNTFNRFHFYNDTFWKAVLSELRDTPIQNAVITNEKDLVCECAFNNIYVIKGRKLLTPSLKTGCFEDLTRSVILKIASDLNLEIMESGDLKFSDLLEMDEIFLASEKEGIQWVLGFRNKRFVHHFSIVIHRKLNEYLKEKAV